MYQVVLVYTAYLLVMFGLHSNTVMYFWLRDKILNYLMGSTLVRLDNTATQSEMFRLHGKHTVVLRLHGKHVRYFRVTPQTSLLF